MLLLLGRDGRDGVQDLEHNYQPEYPVRSTSDLDFNPSRRHAVTIMAKPVRLWRVTGFPSPSTAVAAPPEFPTRRTALLPTATCRSCPDKDCVRPRRPM